jgi:hypothetical protein
MSTQIIFPFIMRLLLLLLLLFSCLNSLYILGSDTLLNEYFADIFLPIFQIVSSLCNGFLSDIEAFLI